MKVFWYLVVYLLQTAFAAIPRVRVDQGLLSGKTYTTRNGRNVFGFLGIPFAKPPVGNLRFRSPQRGENWCGIRDATADGQPCVQNYLQDFRYRNITFGSEDCLYLNVFTPALNRSARLPVMFYIFGAGNFAGTPSSKEYSPEYLLDHDIVLVVSNYRLGPLGFLSTEDDVLPGNYGLKDQTEALKWVRRNIRNFGGNRNSVTLFGNSAGAGDAHLHMMSPLSKGLFHAAISQSGSGLCQWAAHPPGSNRNTSYRVARELGCPTNTSQALARCLRKLPAEKITELTYKFLKFDLDPAVTFPPSVENNISGAFLTRDPWTIKTTIPWMAGSVSQEGSMRTASLIRGGAEGVARLAELNANYTQLLPESIMIEKHAKDPVDISKRVKEFYFGNDSISKAKLPELINMYSDSWFTYCVDEAVRRHQGPMYYYYFSYNGNKSFAYLVGNTEDDLGVCHGDELIYLFPLNAHFSNFTNTQRDITFSKNMVQLWVNFATTRNPTPENSFTDWDPVNTSKTEYLHFTNNGFVMKKNLLKERMDFWRNLPFREKPKLAK